MEQIENPETDPRTYAQLIFDKGANIIQRVNDDPVNKG